MKILTPLKIYVVFMVLDRKKIVKYFSRACKQLMYEEQQSVKEGESEIFLLFFKERRYDR